MSENDHTPKPDDLAGLLHLLEAMDDDVQHDIDPRWEALASGALSAEEAAQLRRDFADDPRLPMLEQAFAPLDTGVRHDLVRAASRHYSIPPVPVSGEVVRAWWATPAVAVAVAIAALFLGMLLTGAPGEPGAPALPPYEGMWQSGERDIRTAPSPTDAAPRFTEGSAVELWLRPTTAPDASPVVVAYVDGWGASHRVELQADVSVSGGIRIHGEFGVAPWTFPVGRHTLHVVLGPAGARFAERPEAPWQTVDLPFDVY